MTRSDTELQQCLRVYGCRAVQTKSYSAEASSLAMALLAMQLLSHYRSGYPTLFLEWTWLLPLVLQNTQSKVSMLLQVIHSTSPFHGSIPRVHSIPRSTFYTLPLCICTCTCAHLVVCCLPAKLSCCCQMALIVISSESEPEKQDICSPKVFTPSKRYVLPYVEAV